MATLILTDPSTTMGCSLLLVGTPPWTYIAAVATPRACHFDQTSPHLFFNAANTATGVGATRAKWEEGHSLLPSDPLGGVGSDLDRSM